MDNYFQLLKQPERPLLNEEGLKSAYLAAIEKNHPDRAGLDKKNHKDAEDLTSVINRANQVLKFPLERFRHLLEVNGFKSESQSILPDSYASLFEQLYSLSQRSEKFVEEFNQAEAEIEKTFLRHNQLKLVGDIQDTQRQLNRLEQSLYDRVKKIDEEWETEKNFEEMSKVVLNLSFCQKWQSQLDRFKSEVLSRV